MAANQAMHLDKTLTFNDGSGGEHAANLQAASKQMRTLSARDNPGRNADEDLSHGKTVRWYGVWPVMAG